MHRWTCLPCAAFAFVQCVRAQTYIVDAANGPGTNYTSITAAVSAVPNGATLIVRPGSYMQFSVNAKGLTILGQPGVVITNPGPGSGTNTMVEVRNTNPNQTVAIRGIAMTLPGVAENLLVVASCQGPVFLQDISDSTPASPGMKLRVDGSGQVMVDHCGIFTINGGWAAGSEAIRVTNSNVVLIEGDVTTTAGYGIRATNSVIHAVGCDIHAGWLPTMAAVDLTSSTLTMTGGGSVINLFASGSAHPACSGSGTLILDPSVPVTGVVAPGIAVINRAMASVTSSGGTAGTSAVGTMMGPPGYLGGLSLGYLAAPTTMPGVSNQIWLATNFAPMAVGVLGPPLSRRVSVPSSPLLLGVVFGWQGVSYHPSTGLVVTNPSLFMP